MSVTELCQIADQGSEGELSLEIFTAGWLFKFSIIFC